MSDLSSYAPTPAYTPRGNASTAKADAALARRLRKVQALAPSLAKDPRAALELARQPLDDDALVESVGKAGAFAEADAAAKAFAERSKDYQQARWPKLGVLEQEALRSGGYEPFWEARKKKAGFNILGLPGAALRRGVTLLDDITTVPQAAIGLGIEGVMKGERAIKHGYRTMRALEDEADSFASTNDLDAREQALVDRVRPRADSILSAWRLTSTGEGYFQPRAIARAFDAMESDDPELYAYVAARAAGKSPDELAESLYGVKMGSEGFEQVWSQLAELEADPGVGKALQILERGKVSPGRDFARDLGLREGTSPYAWVSGMGDAAFTWYSDPTLIGGKVAKAYKMKYDLAEGADAAGKLNRLIGDDVVTRARRKVDDPHAKGYHAALAGAKLNNVERAATLIADHFRHGLEAELYEAQPQIGRLLHALRAYDTALRTVPGGKGMTDPAAVKAFFRTTEGMIAIASGRATTTTIGNMVLPRLGKVHALGLVPKRAAHDVINFTVDADWLLAKTDDQVERLAKAGLALDDAGRVVVPAGSTASPGALAVAKVINKVPGVNVVLPGTAAFVHSVTNLIPKDGHLSLDSPDTPEVLNQVLAFGLRGAEKRIAFNQYMATADPGAKRRLMSSFYETIFERTGVMASPAGREWANKFLLFSRQGYGPAGWDELETIGGVRHIGLLPDVHRADAIEVPNFKELLAAVRKDASMRLYYGVTNNRAMDYWMARIWKPSVLLRIGFIPRAAGEEALAFALRNGPRALFGQALVNVAEGRRFGPTISGKAARAERARLIAAGRPDLARQVVARSRWSAQGRQVIGTDRTAALGPVDWADHAASRVARLLPDPVVSAMTLGHVPDRLLLAHYIEARSHGLSTAVRKVVREHIADPRLLEAAAHAARNPVMATSFADEISAGNAYKDPSLGEDEALNIKTRVTGGTEVRPVRSEVEFVGADQPTYGWAVDGALTELSHDRVANTAADVALAYVTAPQARRIAEAVRFDDLDGDHFDAVIRAQRALSGASVTVRSLVKQYLEGDATALDRAKDMAAFNNRYPHQRDLYRVLHSLPDMVANHAGRDVYTLLHNPERVLARFDDPALVLAPGVAGPPAPSRRAALMARIRRGDEKALDELGPELIVARQQMEDMVDLVPSMETANFSVDDVPVVGAVPPKHLRTYTVVDEAGVPVIGRGTTDLAVAEVWVRDHPGAQLGYLDMDGRRLKAAKDRTAEDVAPGELVYGSEDAELVRPFEDTAVRVPRDMLDAEPRKGPVNQLSDSDLRWEAERLSQRTRAAEKQSDPDDWSPEQRVMYDRGDYAGFSRSRGYTEAEIAEFQRWLETARELERRGLHDDLLALQDPNDALHWDLVSGVTREESMRGWSQRQWGAIKETLVGRASGETMAEAAYDVARRRWTGEKTAQLDPNELPERMRVPKYEPVPHSLSTEVVQKGFTYIGRGIDSLIRKPMYLSAYADALDAARVVEPMLRNAKLDLRARAIFSELGDEGAELQRHLQNGGAVTDGYAKELLGDMPEEGVKILRAWAKMDASVAEMVNTIASQGALAKVIPYIDDHRLRSQMDVWVRNVVPFMFAETQFLKRWARTMRHSPEAFRKAHLTYMGIRHAGWVEKNDFGEDVFIYPGSEMATAALSRVVDRLAPGQWHLPVGVSFGGQVRFAAPGADSPGKPGFGPLVGLPLNLINRFFPETRESAEKLLGERGVGRSLTDLIFPTSVTRALTAFTKSAETSEQMASAAFAVMQILEAKNEEHFARTGKYLVPPEGATDDEWDDYLDRVKNFSRIVAVMRFGLGFTGPAAPMPDFAESLSADFKEALAKATGRGQTFEEALANFIERNPEATPFTVFAHESTSKAPLPATEESYAYIRAHRGFLEAYQDAGPWLLPPADATDPYERRARHEQMAMGMRRTKGLEEFARDLRYAAAAEDYFTSVDSHKAFMAANTDPAARRREMDSWRKWKDEYLAAHPTFAAILNARDGMAVRARVLDQMGEALEHPSAQAAPHYTALKDLYDSHRSHEAFMERLRGDRSAEATRRRRNERKAYANWAAAYSKAHPEVRAFYLRIIRPETDVPPDEELD